MYSHFLLCIDDNGSPESLEKRKFYEVVADASAASEEMVRVIDESGEDYLYPRACFADISHPQQVKRALEASLAERGLRISPQKVASSC
jgi:hypothetical protein